MHYLDSSSSVALLKFLLKERGLDPRPVEMGPDLDTMLERCDGALLIGDRALDRAKTNPELVQLDLGQAWLDLTGQPMVFGVFAARKDTPVDVVQAAHQALAAVAGQTGGGQPQLIPSSSGGVGSIASTLQSGWNNLRGLVR